MLDLILAQFSENWLNSVPAKHIYNGDRADFNYLSCFAENSCSTGQTFIQKTMKLGHKIPHKMLL